MQYRRVGKWGLKLPEIFLGLWHNFAGTAPLERPREIVRRAFELGIAQFDLANYGPAVRLGRGDVRADPPQEPSPATGSSTWPAARSAARRSSSG